MANEAKMIVETGLPIAFTVANGTGIEKGTLCAVTDLMTAVKTSAKGQPCAGIAASEKIASDGKVKLGIYREGIFKVTASGSITVGDPVTNSQDGTNEVEKAATDEEDVWGIAMETASDTHTLLIDLRPTSMSLA